MNHGALARPEDRPPFAVKPPDEEQRIAGGAPASFDVFGRVGAKGYTESEAAETLRS